MVVKGWVTIQPIGVVGYTESHCEGCKYLTCDSLHKTCAKPTEGEHVVGARITYKRDGWVALGTAEAVVVVVGGR